MDSFSSLYGAGPLTHVPVPVIVVTNSNVKHKLSGSEYPDRVRQCKEAVEVIKESFPEVFALRDATMEMIEEVKHKMSDLSYRRAKHCVTEDKRTLATVQALTDGNFAAVGRHMTASHMSLKLDFEVSCPELDSLVDLALQMPGVLGSRMTGGGFGGCTVSLVEPDSVSAFKIQLANGYKRITGLECTFYESLPSAGCGRLSLPLA